MQNALIVGIDASCPLLGRGANFVMPSQIFHVVDRLSEPIVHLVKWTAARQHPVLQVFQDRTRVGRLQRAIPAAHRVQQHEHRNGRNISGGQAVEGAEAEIRRRYFECKAMHEVIEHRGLPEDVKHAALTNECATLIVVTGLHMQLPG